MKTIILSLLIAVFAPLAAQEVKDPVREAARKREKQFKEDNYRELKEASAELVVLSKELADEVDKSGENKMSARIFDKVDKIEKLTKKIRDRARGPY